MAITGPKWVKRAHQWCVTVINKGQNKTSQENKWFSSKDEAENYKNSLKD